jgi:putative tRNA adenosine deaminase-associated protein
MGPQHADRDGEEELMSDFDAEEYESFRLDSDDKDERDAEGAEDAADSDDDLDDDDDDDDDDEEDDDEDLEDADDEEIDFVIAAYREDGQPLAQALDKNLANDLEDLIVQLRRLPGDAGALGFVSLVEEVAVLVRVRGQHVQVLLNDGAAANDWPIARDVADYLNADIIDEDDDEAEPMGDLGIVSDLGVSEFDLESLIDNLDLSSDQVLTEIADKIKIGPEFRRVVEASFRR